MHGYIFLEVEKFVTTVLGAAAWRKVTAQAGLAERKYLNGLDYPDEEVVALVIAAHQITEMPVPDILQAFGKFLGADLFKAFRPLIDPRWRTLEFLENVEATIHRVVRQRSAKSKPPALHCTRQSRSEVLIEYSSARRLCHLAKGIVLGVAEHYGDTVALTEETCMLNGDPHCRIWVALMNVEDETQAEEDLHETRKIPVARRHLVS
jgi:hypothetical protein